MVARVRSPLPFGSPAEKDQLDASPAVVRIRERVETQTHKAIKTTPLPALQFPLLVANGGKYPCTRDDPVYPRASDLAQGASLGAGPSGQFKGYQ